MDKNKFLELIRGYHSLSENNLEEIDEVIAAYPYVQIGHALSAKVNQNIHSPKAGIKIKYAAVYTAERSVLKSLMENKIVLDQPAKPAIKSKSKSKASVPKGKSKAKIVKEIPAKKKAAAASLAPVDEQQRTKHREMMEKLYAEMADNLQELQKYKFQFFEENPDLFEEELKKKNSGKTGLTESETPEATQSPKDNPEIEKQEPEENHRKALKPKSSQDSSESKLQEQLIIIDEFIEASSKLAKLPPPEDDGNKEDLSTLSTTLGNDLISENLANILIKQGKVNDAMDIYKKLIWKFPQKQTYFAARIEELKKI